MLSVDLENNLNFFKNLADNVIKLDYDYIKEGLKKVFNSVEREIRR